MESQKVGCNWVNEQWEGEGFLMNPNAYWVGQKKGGLIPTLVVSYFGQSLWPSSLTGYVLYFQLAILSFMGSLKSWKSILFHSCIFWHHTEHHSRAFGPCLGSPPKRNVKYLVLYHLSGLEAISVGGCSGPLPWEVLSIFFGENPHTHILGLAPVHDSCLQLYTHT